MKAVANAGPLIRLSWLDRLDLLHHLYDEIVVPAAVQHELFQGRADAPGMQALRDAFRTGQLHVRSVADQTLLAGLLDTLDRGEAEAIALLIEQGSGLVLLDDRRARAEARRRGLPLTGTIGILQRARQRGLIEAVMPLLAELRRRGFWVSDGLLEQVAREEAGDDAG